MLSHKKPRPLGHDVTAAVLGAAIKHAPGVCLIVIEICGNIFVNISNTEFHGKAHEGFNAGRCGGRTDVTIVNKVGNSVGNASGDKQK